LAKKMSEAVKITKECDPELVVDGEIQADVAVNDFLLEKFYSFSDLDQSADILVFPDLNSSNIAYKLLLQLSGASSIGPLLVPINASANVLQRTSTVTEIVNMATLTALISQENKK